VAISPALPVTAAGDGRRSVEIARASLLLFLVILVFAPGFGRQYCVWPIALGWALLAGVGGFVYFWKAEETYGRG